MANSAMVSADAAVCPTAPMRGDSGSAVLLPAGSAASGKAACTALGLVACTTRPLKVASAQLWYQGWREREREREIIAWENQAEKAWEKVKASWLVGAAQARWATEAGC